MRRGRGSQPNSSRWSMTGFFGPMCKWAVCAGFCVCEEVGGALGRFWPGEENGQRRVRGSGEKSGGGGDWSFDAFLFCSGGPEAGIDVGEDAVAAFDFGEPVFLGFGEDAG